MAHIKWLIVMLILLLMAFLWTKYHYPDYGAMPFSIESYTVLDSIRGSDGIGIHNGNTTYPKVESRIRIWHYCLLENYL
ncbi:MAG TPA: hypothetical protein PK076_13970 [Saprospiraceae bacterium]|nr:hypothetical protein [Saprospiraceae bacterium]